MDTTLYSASLRLGAQVTEMANAGTVPGGRGLYFLGYRMCSLLLAAAADPEAVADSAKWADVVRLGDRLARMGWRPAAVIAYRMGREIATAAQSSTVAPAAQAVA